MKQTIAVEGIKLYAYHGCLDEKGIIGGHYRVDVYMQADFSEAAKTDDLSKTIDYCAVYEIAKKEMAVRAKLIEEVVMRIQQNIMNSFPGLQEARVRFTKLTPPMNGNVEKVYVEVE